MQRDKTRRNLTKRDEVSARIARFCNAMFDFVSLSFMSFVFESLLSLLNMKKMIKDLKYGKKAKIFDILCVGCTFGINVVFL